MARSTAIWRLIFGLAGLEIYGCKPSPSVQESPVTVTQETNAAKKEGDTADPPAPVAGAYLTCVIAQPKTSDEATAGCQLRSEAKKRLPNLQADQATWSYVPPKGIDPSTYEITFYRLSAANKNYYFHAAFRIKKKAPAASSLRLAEGPSAFSLLELLTPMAVAHKGDHPVSTGTLAAATYLARKEVPLQAAIVGPGISFDQHGAFGASAEPLPEAAPEIAVLPELPTTAEVPAGDNQGPPVTDIDESHFYDETAWPKEDANRVSEIVILKVCDAARLDDNNKDSDCDGIVDGGDKCKFTPESLLAQVIHATPPDPSFQGCGGSGDTLTN